MEDVRKILIENAEDYNFKDVIEILEIVKMDHKDTNKFIPGISDARERILMLWCNSENKESLEEKKDDILDAIISLTKCNKKDYCIREIIIAIDNNISNPHSKLEKKENKITIKSKEVTLKLSDENIKQGGFGAVVKHQIDDIYYAYKFFYPSSFQASQKKELINRFKREAKKMMFLSHEHIPRIYDYGIDEKEGYIKMEYIEGETLDNFLGKTIGEKNKLNIVEKIVDTMGFIHKKGILHRDLSLNNIMISKDNDPKIIDFGFSKKNGETLFTPLGHSVAQTFPCEETKSNEYDYKAEVYAVGKIIEKIIKSGNELEEISKRKEKSELEVYNDIVEKMVTKKSARYNDCYEVAEEFKKIKYKS